MSGGGGGDATWRRAANPIDGNSIDDSSDPCSIQEVTTINSPDRSIITKLRSGDVLDVVLISGPPRRLVVADQSGHIAGSITSPSLPQIVSCIRSGVNYAAEVLSVRGAICQVRIQRQ